MGRFDKGVEYYTKVWIPVGFPEDSIVCRYCPMCKLRLVQSSAAAYCHATGMMIDNVDQKPADCPAVVEVDKEVT